MSANLPEVVRGAFKPKCLMSVAAALMLSACSNAMERFAENPSDADPVYTASVPKEKSASRYVKSDDDVITSEPLAGASQPPVYNYGAAPKKAAYKQPDLDEPEYAPSKAPQVAAVEAPSAPAGGKVTVGSGMTLYSIARANNLSVSELAAANNIRAPYAVHTGQVLRIPGSGQASLPEPSMQAPAKKVVAASAPAVSGGMHQVASGETLFSLGRKYKVSPYAIASANGLSNDTQLSVGQKVKIPGGASSGGVPFAKKAPVAEPQAQVAKIAAEDIADEGDAAPAKTAEAMPAPQKSVEEPASAPQTVADAGGPGMRWPVRGKVISNFGSKPNGLKNEGINISVPEGTSIRAAEGGVVAYSGNELKGYGNLVLIRHDGGYVTAYAHAKELFVKRGDTVKRGDVIAKAGQTGSVSSPQLHFEVRKGATALDPIKFLSSATASN